MSGKILGIPESDYEYEFMVVKAIPTVDTLKNEDYLWAANFENANEAEAYAHEIGGIVCHNLRIAHKQLKQKAKDNIRHICETCKYLHGNICTKDSSEYAFDTMQQNDWCELWEEN